MKILGIAGGTASGKTTVARALVERLGPTAALLSHDRYYRDVPEPAGFNYDHPDALDTALLVQNLDELRRHGRTELPVYTFASHRRQARTETLVAPELLVVEGILVLAGPQLVERFDLRVYVHAPDDIRLARRVRRDAVERGRTAESVLDQYLATVRPMHERFVAPSRALADLVLDGTTAADGLVDQLLELIGG